MLHPLVKWAQRKDRVFLQIGLRDVVEQKIDIAQDKISFNGISDSNKYAFQFQLFASVDIKQSKWTKTGFHIIIILQKKQTDKPYWLRLTKSTAKNQYIQIDWAKWIDEDDEQEQAQKGMGALDPSQMQAFKGYPGMDQPDDQQQEEENINNKQQPEQIDKQQNQRQKQEEEQASPQQKKNN